MVSRELVLQDKIEDLIIIGAGPVGIFAFFQASILGINCLIIESSSILGGQPNSLYRQKPIYDIPGFTKILASDLIENLLKQASSIKNLRFELNMEVLFCEKVNQLIKITTNKKVFFAKTVIIATGPGKFEYTKIDIKNHDDLVNKKLFYNIEDLNFFKDKNIAIAGGGDSAIDWAIELSKISNHITLVHRRAKFRGFDSSIIALKTLEENNKLKIILNSKINLFLNDNLEIENMINGIKSNLKVDFLLVFFGLVAKNNFLQNSLINSSNNQIIVTSKMQSSVENIYAIGDIALYEGKLNLILSGFHEAAIATRECYKYIYKKNPSLEHSTSLIN